VIPFDSRIARADRLGSSIPELGQQDLLAPFRELLVNLDSRIKEKTP